MHYYYFMLVPQLFFNTYKHIFLFMYKNKIYKSKYDTSIIMFAYTFYLIIWKMHSIKAYFYILFYHHSSISEIYINGQKHFLLFKSLFILSQYKYLIIVFNYFNLSNWPRCIVREVEKNIFCRCTIMFFILLYSCILTSLLNYFS